MSIPVIRSILPNLAGVFRAALRDHKGGGWLIAALLLAGLVEGFGLVTLLPVLSILTGGETSDTGIGGYVTAVLAVVGIEPSLIKLLVIVVICISLKACVVLFAMLHVRFATARIGLTYRLSFLNALFRANWAYFRNEQVGSFANAMGMEAQNAADTHLAAYRVITDGIQTCIYLAVALVFSPIVMVTGLMFGAVLLLLYKRLISLARKSGEQEAKALEVLSRRLVDCFRGIKAIKAMARERFVAPLLENEISDIRSALKRRAVAGETRSQLIEPAILIVVAPALYFGVTYFGAKLETMLVMAFLFHRIVTRAAEVQGFYQTFVTTEAFYKTLRIKIGAAEQARENLRGNKPAEFLRNISYENVEFAYDREPVLRGVSLDVPVSQVTAIIGPSGAGKTTLIDLLIALATPDSGTIRIDDTTLDEIDVGAWRGRIGYVPQETLIFHDTILANVTLNQGDLTEADAERALKAAGAWEFVQFMSDGMHTIVGEGGSKISGGQRQRLAIARALAHRPALLILDEATSALDPETEKAICQTLRGLANEVTILAISHQPAIMSVADRVYRIEDGNISLFDVPGAVAAP